MGTFKFNAGGNPVMDYNPIQGEKKYCKHLSISHPFLLSFGQKTAGPVYTRDNCFQREQKGL